jgi:toxin HigB-1
MIKQFKCRETQALFEGKRTRRFANIESVAIRKLQMLHAVERLESLRIPPQNRLEALKGDRKGQWSIRVNDQWRVCFTWKDGAAWDVEIVDYN